MTIVDSLLGKIADKELVLVSYVLKVQTLLVIAHTKQPFWEFCYEKCTHRMNMFQKLLNTPANKKPKNQACLIYFQRCFGSPSFFIFCLSRPFLCPGQEFFGTKRAYLGLTTKSDYQKLETRKFITRKFNIKN